MKDFTYIDADEFNLHACACEWLRDMGLKETRWILDRAWFSIYNNSITFDKWINN